MICDIGDITSSSVSRKNVVWAGHFFSSLCASVFVRSVGGRGTCERLCSRRGSILDVSAAYFRAGCPV